MIILIKNKRDRKRKEVINLQGMLVEVLILMASQLQLEEQHSKFQLIERVRNHLNLFQGRGMCGTMTKQKRPYLILASIDLNMDIINQELLVELPMEKSLSGTKLVNNKLNAFTKPSLMKIRNFA